LVGLGGSGKNSQQHDNRDGKTAKGVFNFHSVSFMILFFGVWFLWLLDKPEKLLR
jgi:hypothetical protein